MTDTAQDRRASDLPESRRVIGGETDGPEGG